MKTLTSKMEDGRWKSRRIPFSYLLSPICYLWLCLSAFAQIELTGSIGAIGVLPKAGYITNGLVAWWKFDDGSGTTAADSWDANTGSLSNSPAWTNGIINGAISLNGTQYAAIPNGAALINNDLHSVSLWFNATSVANSPALWSARGTNELAGEGFVEIISATSLLWAYRTVTNANTYRTYTVPDISSGWHHLVTVKSAATTGDLYLDGVLQSSYAGNFVASAFDDNLRFVIGEYVSSFGIIPFNGAIDDFRIYDRALLAAEALQIYNGQ